MTWHYYNTTRAFQLLTCGQPHGLQLKPQAEMNQLECAPRDLSTSRLNSPTPGRHCYNQLHLQDGAEERTSEVGHTSTAHNLYTADDDTLLPGPRSIYTTHEITFTWRTHNNVESLEQCSFAPHLTEE
jgi:hypothetical protein